ncbi:tyrosine-type recombinase/integrase [Alsobacter sp. R-9]
MARILSEAPITTRPARAALPRRAKPYWRGIDPDVHLGYRSAPRGGRWVVRWREGSVYRQETVGTADDHLPADGDGVLDFRQAERKARVIVATNRKDAADRKAGPPVTVRSVIETYVASREARERQRAEPGAPLKRDTRSRLKKHVLSAPLADVTLSKLDEAAIEAWRAALPATMAPTTVRRVIGDLKAALNAAARTYRTRLPGDFGNVVRYGFHSEEAIAAPARKIVLSDAEVRRLVEAAWSVDERDGWNGDLARLIIVLAATGARFSQVRRLTVADVQTASSRIMVPTSHKGRGTKRTTHVPFPVGPDVIEALRPAMARRRGTDVLLERIHKKPAGPLKWEITGRGPWHPAASHLLRPFAEVVAEAGFSADVTAYALRHSSIVRGLREQLPVRLVAALHDTSSAMIERHYAAFIVDALDELAARAVIPVTSAPVAPLRVAK